MAGGLPGLGIMVPTWLVGKFTIELDAFRTFGSSMFWGFPSHVWNLKCFANLVRFSHVFLGGSMKGMFFISIKNRAIYLFEWELHIFISWRWWASFLDQGDQGSSDDVERLFFLEMVGQIWIKVIKVVQSSDQGISIPLPKLEVEQIFFRGVLNHG